MKLRIAGLPSSAVLSSFLVGCLFTGASLAQHATPSSGVSLKDLDLSSGLDTYEDILKGKHHFSASEKLFSYEHSNGPVPENARKSFEQGLKQHFEHKDDDALKSYDKALKAAPKYLPIYIEKAALLADKHNSAEALTVCSQMLAIDPKYLPALHLQGCCYGDLKQNDKAAEAWSKAIATDKHDLVAFAQRSKVYAAMGKKEEAQRDQEEANHLSLPQKVAVLMADGRSSEALSAVQAEVKKYPNDLELRTKELLLMMSLNKYPETIDSAAKIAKQWPEMKGPMSYFQAKSYSSLGQFDKAIERFTDAIAEFARAPQFKGEYAQLESNMFEHFGRALYLDRAEAFRKAKQFDKGVADCSKFIKDHPKVTMGYDERAIIYESAGDAKKALADYKQAISLNQRDPRAQDGIDRLGDKLSGKQSGHKSSDAAAPD